MWLMMFGFRGPNIQSSNSNGEAGDLHEMCMCLFMQHAVTLLPGGREMIPSTQHSKDCARAATMHIHPSIDPSIHPSIHPSIGRFIHPITDPSAPHHPTD